VDARGRGPRQSLTAPIPSFLPFEPVEDPAISDRTIWLLAIGLIVLDLALFMVPIVPFLVAYVLVARPPWFKTFVDDLYNQS